MTMADPIRDNLHSQYAGHTWTPGDFKPEARQVDGTHYLSKAIQPWDIIETYGLDFFEGNVLKYLLRRKPGVSRVTDLHKAQHYLSKCIELAEGPHL